MNTTETTPNTDLRTGSIPVRATTETKAGVDSPPLAKGELASPATAPFDFRPQSSPKAGPTTKRHKSNQGYATPPNFVRACEEKFRRRVAWDLAANEANTKADRWYDEAMNALLQPWHRISAPGGMLFLNPPFDDIAPWAEKCAAESALPGCAPILLLTPASIGSNWFRDHVYPKALVFALNGRIQFVGASDPYPKDLMLSVYGLDFNGLQIWTLPKDARA